MTAAPAISPVVRQIFDLFHSLSEPEKKDVCEKLVEIQADDAYEIPDSHWAILEERERLRDQGLDQAIPAEEAFQYIREKLRQHRAAS